MSPHRSIAAKLLIASALSGFLLTAVWARTRPGTEAAVPPPDANSAVVDPAAPAATPLGKRDRKTQKRENQTAAMLQRMEKRVDGAPPRRQVPTSTIHPAEPSQTA